MWYPYYAGPHQPVNLDRLDQTRRRVTGGNDGQEEIKPDVLNIDIQASAQEQPALDLSCFIQRYGVLFIFEFICPAVGS